MFRRVGGFVYVMAVLVSLEGCMAEVPDPPWDTVPRQTMLSLVHGAFHTLTMAMRYEPANAKFFQLEVRWWRGFGFLFLWCWLLL